MTKTEVPDPRPAPEAPEPASSGALSRWRHLLEPPAPAPRDAPYEQVRSELYREEREAMERAQALHEVVETAASDFWIKRALRGALMHSGLAGYARGFRAGLRADRRLAEEARTQATRAVAGLQDEVGRLNEEVARLRAELEEARRPKEKKVRSVRKEGVHVPENADEAQRVARNIEEFLRVSEDGAMDLEEIRARLPEEANVRDALHHLLLSRRATLSGTVVKLARAG